MTLERFAALVDAFGAEARRWPPAERAAAVAFAADNAAAAALLHEAAALDAQLDADVAAPATAAARQAVIAALPVAPVSTAQRWREFLALLGGWQIAAPAMAMALVAGINIGATTGVAVFSTAAPVSTATETDSSSDDARYTPGFAESLILGLQQAPQ